MNDAFISRLKEVIEYYGLSPSLFADKIGVQRSSVSHVLSGRNRPSLEFVMKLVTIFPEVNIYWLMNGKGTFPQNKNKSGPSTTENDIPKISAHTSNTIDKIVVFYKDGTFTSFEPKN